MPTESDKKKLKAMASDPKFRAAMADKTATKKQPVGREADTVGANQKAHDILTRRERRSTRVRRFLGPHAD
jgi:hypothetical protein